MLHVTCNMYMLHVHVTCTCQLSQLSLSWLSWDSQRLSRDAESQEPRV